MTAKLMDRRLGVADTAPQELKDFADTLSVVVGAQQAVIDGNLVLDQHAQVDIKDVSFVQPDDWSGLAFSGTWANFGGGYFDGQTRKKWDGDVELRGLVKGGTAGSTIAVLPVAYRPARSLTFDVLTGSPDAIGRVEILANGNVNHVSGTLGYVSLENIRFAAADRSPARFAGTGWPLKAQPWFQKPCRAVIPCRLQQSDQGVRTAAPTPLIGWENGQDGVNITGVWGPTPGKSYTLTVAMFF